MTTISRARRLSDRIARLERQLAELGRRGRLAAARLSEHRVAADFRTRRSAARGVERDVPAVFTLDDDPGALDLGRLGASFPLNPAWSMLNGELKVTRSVLLAEAECILIIDLSRSVFSGCLGVEWGEGLRGPEWSKLEALYSATAAFLGAAEVARLSIRIVSIHGGTFSEERSRSCGAYVASALALMSRRLVATFRTAEDQPESVERFALADALCAPLRLKARSDVVVISDFLDPMGPGPEARDNRGYLKPLAEVMARHNVRVVDIAWPGVDRAIPLPRLWIDVNAVQADHREGAWHLEQGPSPRWNRRAAIRRWNSARNSDLARLDALLARRHLRRDEIFVKDTRGRTARPLDARACHALALDWIRNLC
jgi:hypothetical protein